MRARTIIVAMLALSACGPSNLDPADPAFQLLHQGRYGEARKALEAKIAKDPDNPFLQFDLASDYQYLGRMDLAAPLYRKLIRNEDAKDIVPAYASDPYEQGMTLADMACTNLRRGLRDNFTC